MANVRNRIEEGSQSDPFMTGWLTVFTALNNQSPVFKLSDVYPEKREAIVDIAGHEVTVSFASDNKTVTWESKDSRFTLDCFCTDWMYSENSSSTLDESFEALISPVFTVGDQQFTIAFERFLSTDKHVVKKSIIATAPEK